MAAVTTPNFTRPTSTSFVERANVGPSVISLMAQDQRDCRAHLRSKSMAWKEPMMLLQRMSSSRKLGKATVSGTFRRKDAQELHHKSSSSKWARFWRKLKFDGMGKKVHASRPEWLNYDSQSYAMNFEKDRDTPLARNSQTMPKISGPGAREIVTVILQRSPSTNRNSGCILIPKPVLDGKSEADNLPLWQRRSVSAPSSLEVKLKAASIKRRTASVA